ncbi:DUF3289 family protein [Xenorhabdus bovienii]|uniref:PAAR domain-containing protein n=1 Tax=Xenorhabdus bovienii TaxID=40576 RepID=UPI0023B2DD05|nr:PAAR domain-containing protein [Xenorhabdus bovienii]MDE9556488.1 DUF3289 family protein [Xenorhabdus bovienii]
MAKGHFLTVGDKTECGGQILSGTRNITFYGHQAAVEGSAVTCGRHSGTYLIAGGVSSFFDAGTRLAGTLDSLSTCPCRAGFIHSIPDSYGNDTYFADVAPQNFAWNAGTNSQSTQPSQGNSSKYSTSKLSDTHQSAQRDQKPKPEPLPLPAVIFKTQRQMDDYDAKDMKCGDLTEEDLKNKFGLTDVGVPCRDYSVFDFIAQADLPKEDMAQWCGPYSMEDREASAKLLFDKFRELSGLFSFYGEYQELITKMITHMQGNTGAVFTDPLLDKAMSERISEDRSDNSTLLNIKQALTDNIDWSNGYYLLDKEYLLNDSVMQSKLPIFNNIIDRINGLVISVHDTWATHITLQSLEVNGDRFRATIHYRIQDHFGLDDEDVTDSVYRQFRIFRIWFVLQRWEEYKYKPFITEMNVIKVIEGSRYEKIFD